LERNTHGYGDTTVCIFNPAPEIIHGVIISLGAPDDYSTKNTQKYFKQFQSLTVIT
jgi:hypothetical protein